MVTRSDQGISERAVLLSGFQRGSESIAVAAAELENQVRLLALAGVLELALLPTSNSEEPILLPRLRFVGANLRHSTAAGLPTTCSVVLDHFVLGCG